MEVAQSCLTLWNSPGQNTGVGSYSLLQGIFPTQGSNPSLPHCKQILYQLSHKGSPRIPKGVGSQSLLQQIFPTQESNQGLLRCRQILYQLSYQGALKNLSNQLWPGDPNHAGVGLPSSGIKGWSQASMGVNRNTHWFTHLFLNKLIYIWKSFIFFLFIVNISLPIGNSMMLNHLILV